MRPHFHCGGCSLSISLNGKRVLVTLIAISWLDIGRPDDHLQAIKGFERGRDRFLGKA
jgi:hypothetical protein